MKRLSVLITMCLVGTMIGMLQLSPAQGALPGQPHIVAEDGDHFWDFETPPWGTAGSPTGCAGPGGVCIYTHMGPSGAAPGQVAVPGGSGSLAWDNDGADAMLGVEGYAFLDRFGGTRLDDVIDLDYWTHNRNLSTHPAYAGPPNAVNTTILLPSDHAELHLWVDTDNDGFFDEEIVFDPNANFASQNPTMTSTVVLPADGDVNQGWYSWDPLAGLWYVEGAPGTTFTWTSYINDNLGAKLATDTAPIGYSVGGEGRHSHGHIDNAKMGIFQNTRNYDFEAEATPGADRCHVIDAGCTYTQTYGTPTLVSQTLTAVPPALANDDSRQADVSADDDHISFSSFAGNLTIDNGPWEDVFQYNTATGIMATVSSCPAGVCAGGGSVPNDNSYNSDQSDDGRYVVFRSDASNLVAGDTNGVGDIFRKDMLTGLIERVNTTSGGVEGNRWGNNPTISGDGNFVAFSSKADNLVPGDSNEDWDIFVKDMTTGAIERILRNSGFQTQFNEKKAQISGDGTYVTFVSGDSNIVAGDANDRIDVFRWNRVTDTSNLVSVNGATQGNRRSTNPSISYFGDLIAFQTSADNLGGDTNGEQPDIYLANGDGSGTPRLVSVKSDDTTQSNQGAYKPSLGYFGGTEAYVAFESEATNLGFGEDTNQDRDIFVRIVDLVTPANSITIPYTSGVAPSFRADINPFGVLAYESHATNLLELDTNHRKDIFLVDAVTDAANQPDFLP